MSNFRPIDRDTGFLLPPWAGLRDRTLIGLMVYSRLVGTDVAAKGGS
jgi:hypothetical protein